MSIENESRRPANQWSDARLQNLFNRYNKHYWSGRLPHFRCIVGSCGDGTLGLCLNKTRTITVDTLKHRSDAHVRQTVLHEMAHAASPTSRGGGHDLKFFAQLEKLLQRGARISIDSPEAGEAHILANIVPARFVLLNRKMKRAEAQRVRAITSRRLGKAIEVSNVDIVQRFEDAAMYVTWKAALLHVGLENGLTDEAGRPVNRWAGGIIKAGKRAYNRARRDHLSSEKLRLQFQ